MFKRLRKPLVTLGGVGVALYSADTFLNEKTFQRNIRTLWNGLVITIDYKLNFQPGKAEKIQDLQRRVANRILAVCKENGGLYIKFGQQIASLNHVLPPEWNQTFKVLYDEAPTVPISQVETIFEQDFGKKPSEMYASFDPEPVASASIAQVHKATLNDGTQVAVKVQKPYIARQMDWDLRTYRLVTILFEMFFDLPLNWTVDYIEKHMRTEADFINEGRNSERAFENIKQVNLLRDYCYVPKVYWDQSSKRVLTCEWIEGIRFGDKQIMENNGFNPSFIMRIIVDLFSDVRFSMFFTNKKQIFRTGFLHCDPHPGNILLRMNPKHPSRPQVVLIDHGLYSESRPSFRQEYALFWKSLFTLDQSTLENIANSWGIKDVQMFASSTLQKPWRPGQKLHIEQKTSLNDIYEMQSRAKERVKEFLSNTALFPRELLFIGRNLNLIRSNNKGLGSPVNRINLMVDIAVQSLGTDKSVWTNQTSTAYYILSPSLVSWVNYIVFRSTLFISSMAFYFNKFIQKTQALVLGWEGKGYEERLDATMRQVALQRYGIVLDENAFDA